MKKRNYYFFAGGAIALIVLCSVLSFKLAAPKTAYIDIKKVFNEFTYKKELETELNKVKLARQNLLDSMKIQLDNIYQSISTSPKPEEKLVDFYKLKREEYYRKTEEFEQTSAELARSYDEKIIAQMRQYISDYGEKNNYAYIYGDDGNGHIAYASKGNDITDIMIEYVNKRFGGE